MRSEDHPAALIYCVLNRRQRGTNTRVIFNLAFLNRDVEIDTNENPLAFEIEILNGKFCHLSDKY